MKQRYQKLCSATLSMAFTGNDKNETFAVCLQLPVQ